MGRIEHSVDNETDLRGLLDEQGDELRDVYIRDLTLRDAQLPARRWLHGHFLDVRATSADLTASNFSGCLFERSHFHHARWSRSAFTDSRYARCVLHEAVFHEAVFDRCSFRDSSLTFVDARSTTWTSCEVEDVVLDDARLCSSTLVDVVFRDVKLRRADLSHLEACGGGILFEGVDASSSRWRGARVSRMYCRKSSFSGASLAGVTFSELSLEDTCMDGCDFTGTRVSAGRLTATAGTTMRAAVLCAAALQASVLADVNLEAADLANANLDGADLRRTLLRHANLDGASLKGANLEDADLRGASVRGTDFGGASLRGALMPDSEPGAESNDRGPAPPKVGAYR